MGKTEVIVDTCFLQKLSSEGKAIDNIKKVLTELEYIPVVHPYIYEHELSLHSYFVRLVEEGYIRVIQYNEFQKDATSIYNTHKQGSSMGDVHMILMASYLQMPIY